MLRAEKNVIGLTIAVIDKSEFFRVGVCQRLASQRDFKLVECNPTEEPLRFIETNSTDVVLLDIDSPAATGLGLCRSITRNHPDTAVVVMSPSFNEDELFETVKAGAAAYVDKRTSASDLVCVIRRAGKGEYPINDTVASTRSVADRILREFQDMAATGLIKERLAAPLTQREIQILSQIANGGTNKEIGRHLGISEQTIKNHVSAILRKLNANDRAHAVALAVHNRWVSITGD